MKAYWFQESLSPYIPSEEELSSMVYNHINSFIGRRFDGSMQMINFTFLLKDSTLVDHKEFWSFVYDHEFLMTVLFQNLNIFPKLYTICNHFYVLEYAKPFITNPLLPINHSWNTRIQKAIELVKYTEKLESVWYEPFHLCDVKHDHFGWNLNNDIKFLDLDCVVTDSSLKTIMLSTPSCSSDEDCSFFDCHGRCLPSKRCSGQRQNTNLQSLCYKIFLGNTDTSFVPLSGLLKGPEASEDLKDVLELCVTNPGTTSDVMIDALESELILPSIAHNEL